MRNRRSYQRGRRKRGKKVRKVYVGRGGYRL